MTASTARSGGEMAERSWFVAVAGKQEGPYIDAQFRDLIGQGRVAPDTLVWSEGMSDWQRAGDIPGLFSSAARPPAFPQSGPPQVRGSYAPEGPLSVDFGTFDLFWRALVTGIGELLVIPSPWVATWFYGWLLPHVWVPGRPDLGFTGKAMDIWYVFMVLALSAYLPQAVDISWLPLVLIPIQAFLSWMILRWFVANISSEGRPLQLAFAGSVWVYIGWNLLLAVSAITIIGWAWVLTAWQRWMCRNLAGTRRSVVFEGSGLQVLWRTIVLAIGCGFLIPIPWVLAWYVRWYASQFALVERAA
jgi:hypothetical protein